MGWGFAQISLDDNGLIGEGRVAVKNLSKVMKSRISHLSFVAGLAVSRRVPLGLTAQEPSAPVTAPPAAVTVQAPAPVAVDTARLPYGVADVAKLSKAQVSEEVIVTYIQNSGTAYNLGPNEILYLR